MASDSAATAASAAQVLAGLDNEQRAAVSAPSGPVCLLAGAGTGKTRAITHRIAYRVLTGEIAARHVLAVTFTTRAAAELRNRLAALGAQGISARTFHAAALRQLRYFAPRLFDGRPLPELIESKARLVTAAATQSRVKVDRLVARDLAGEIEWAKSSLVEPDEYLVAAAKAGRDTPLPAESVAAIYTAYEQLKRGASMIDFEDLLRAAAWGIEEHPDVADQVRAQYRHFVVDEYQDVNPLQQKLLDAWLGGRDDLTVVGDASQTIYSFTGATSDFLVDFGKRYRAATVVRLVRDYRSTPQVVALANNVIGQARGAQAKLRLELIGQRPAGPTPEVRMFTDEAAEAGAVARRCAELIAGGTKAHEIAVLFRTNAQSESYEEALADCGVPYVVQGAERFFERPEVRAAMIALRGATRSVEPGTALVDAVVAGLSAVGWQPEAPPLGGAARERWEALAALVTIARSMATFDIEPDLTAYCEELNRRAAAQQAPTVDGVVLSSLHSAKGLEWDAVFLVGLTEGTIPTGYAKTAAQIEEERRLLYVGITRARHWLWLSYGAARSGGGRPRRPSRFLDSIAAPSASAGERARPKRGAEAVRRNQIALCRMCGTTLLSGADRKVGRCADCASDVDEDLHRRLLEWRTITAQAKQVPAYVVFTDATVQAIAERRPGRDTELISIAGIGPRKLGLYGPAVLALVAGARVSEVASDLA